MNSNQDWFLMTGDLIINLRSTKTGDSSSSLKCDNDSQKSAQIKRLKSTILDDNQNQIKDQDDNHQYSNKSGENIVNDDDALDKNYDHYDNDDHNIDQNDCLEDCLRSNFEEELEDAKETSIDEPIESRRNDKNIDGEKDIFQQPPTVVIDTITSSKISNSSSGNSSGIVDEDVSNSHSYSDGLSQSSPNKSMNCSREFNFYYDKTHTDFLANEASERNEYEKNSKTNKLMEHCYENIIDCKYLSKSHESNLYNLIETDSKSIDNISFESDNSSLSYYINGKQRGIDTPSASRLAKRLYNLEGFKKSDVAPHLCKNNEFCRAVAEEYLKLFDFTDEGLDDALRNFLSYFHLIGETQERERVLVYFSKRYQQCNPETEFKSLDSIHTLTCALILLNTDLHEETIQRKMSCSNFILNLAGMNDGDDYPSSLLKYLYYSIKNNPLGWLEDEVIMKSKKDRSKVFSKITTISKSINSPYATLPRKFNNNFNNSNQSPFVELPNPTFAIEYKKGYIRRKCCYDSNGRKTSLGKRSWKLFYATLRDLVLYLHKDENGFRKPHVQENFTNSIRIHHSIASVANDYPKKKFVFRLITANYAEYLFETRYNHEFCLSHHD
ncbi:PH and SEC7 domain-containing protein 2 [Sarcoptes scabiei]|uniref:PH and SEC7 domain-containing protein 2 n=2 Tax=Sarcoptes scabiei TaxID=52283 RepID=A0A834V927_SARSC|nr:PH and SEC7 domain-containing protein 2 [Sarcoptes scabiei]